MNQPLTEPPTILMIEDRPDLRIVPEPTREEMVKACDHLQDRIEKIKSDLQNSQQKRSSTRSLNPQHG